MEEIQWYYPDSLDQVPALLARDGVIPHAGGTGILRGGFSQVRGLMDIGRLDLRRLERRNGQIILGAGLSYAETARALAGGAGSRGKQSGSRGDSGCYPARLLVRSLSAAAAQPLRNRITLGGSIALFPYWSDLMGPLLALEAELTLVGRNSGTRPVAEYVENRDLRRQSLITSVGFSESSWPESGSRAVYHRHTRTPADRPAFSITVLIRLSAKRVEEVRIVVVGCSGRYRRLGEIEGRLKGVALPGDPADSAGAAVAEAAALAAEAAAGLELDFPARMGFSAEYLGSCARIELERALTQVLAAGSRRRKS